MLYTKCVKTAKVILVLQVGNRPPCVNSLKNRASLGVNRIMRVIQITLW